MVKYNKKIIQMIFLISIAVVILTQFTISLEINNLKPEIMVKLDSNYKPNIIDAYLYQGPTIINLNYDKVSDDYYEFTLEGIDFLYEGAYNFVLKYLDHNNELKEKTSTIRITRPIPSLTTNFKQKKINNINYILINTLENDLEFTSTEQLKKMEYKLYKEKSDAGGFNELTINNHVFSIDFESLSFTMPEEGQEEYFLDMKLYDIFEIEYSQVYNYKIVLDDKLPEIDFTYGDNVIYNEILEIKINASEPVICKYSHNDFQGVFTSEYKKDGISLLVTNLNNKEYDFKLECEDFVGNMVEKEFTVLVDSQADNKILSIKPDKYLNRDLKFIISTNRESTCKYKITEFNESPVSLNIARKIHEVIIPDRPIIKDLSEIHLIVNCSFENFASFGLKDDMSKILYFDFLDPEVSINARDTYKNVINASISLYDNFEFKECFLKIEGKSLDCSNYGINYKKEKNISKEIEIPYTLEIDREYEVCLFVKDGAGNIIEKCSRFKKDLSLTPEGIATCSDGIKNQGESDIDCGGPCKKCELNAYCNRNADCQDNADCVKGYCVLNHCYNYIFDTSLGEMGRDCGGPCTIRGLKCEVDSKCEKDSDCQSGFCNLDEKICKIPTCDDGFKNQYESDVDCGGSSCEKCDVGLYCSKDSDCQTGVCSQLTKQCSQYTQSELESMKEQNEEDAKEAGFKEKNPLMSLLYIGLGFIILIVGSFGYYAYAHKSKNNYDKNTNKKNDQTNQSNQNNQSNQFDQNNQNGNINRNMNQMSFGSNSRNAGQSIIQRRMNNNSRINNDNFSKEFVNTSNENKFNSIKNININKENVSNLSEKLKNSKSFTTSSKEKRQGIINRINIKSKQIKEEEKQSFSKDDFKNLSKEELLEKLRAVKKLKEIQETNSRKITMEDIEGIKKENKEAEMIDQLKEIEARRENELKQRKDDLKKEIESLLNDDETKSTEKTENKSNDEIEKIISKDIDKNQENKDKKDNKENNKEEKDIFEDLEDEIKSKESVFDKIDKI
ncbi:MAG: hypothetical protein PHT94_02625 [Candidatus Nanoarchaeia archaeon]|nr:hypothetical protein [Candidatus Nanoarchaeia archaeon]